MFDITPVIEAVFALIAVIVTAIVIPYIKSKTTAQQQAEINSWVRIAVSAAEQIYAGSGLGAVKKQYVLDWLHAHGVTADEDKLDALIEAAVYELNYNGIIEVGEPCTVEGFTAAGTVEKPLSDPDEANKEWRRLMGIGTQEAVHE